MDEITTVIEFACQQIHLIHLMTAQQTPSADDNHVIWLKDLKKASKWTLIWNCLVISPNTKGKCVFNGIIFT